MDFVFSEEEQMGKGKLIPFSCSSSSSPPSSSSHHKSHLISLRWDQQQPKHQIYSNWLTNKYDPDDENDRTATNNSYEESSSSRRRDSDSTEPDLIRSASSQMEKEHMFDKVITPSDVGKLNRLVIPKQHAERFFPLDSSTNGKGLLLSFEDPSGKPWKFRYSYWNSSQSYVMTKGWSRFVKEKKLDAGDIVLFQRGVGEVNKDSFFIDRKKRPNVNDRASFHPQQHLNFHQTWSPLLMTPATQPLINRSNHYYGDYAAVGGNVVSSGIPLGVTEPVYYLGSGEAQAPPQMDWQQHGGVEPIVFESVPAVPSKAATKRLRLFGVNLECCPTTESDDSEIISAHPVAAASPEHGLPTPSQLYNETPLPHHQSDFLT